MLTMIHKNTPYPENLMDILESGQVIHLPQHSYAVHNKSLLNPQLCDAKKKNISYDYQKQQLAGLVANHPHHAEVQKMMHEFALYAKSLIDKLLNAYQDHLRWGRTSYRPVEIQGRVRSKRQDDTRLHVDAFPATPVQGWRILRVFCNVNPNDQPRVWNLGEPFADVLKRFSPTLAPYRPFQAKLLHRLRATKTLRWAYDHYMLQLHDQMKLNDNYQATVQKTTVDFAANSTWIVFTDHVSHAALSGQYLLEQTFYLPWTAMKNPQHSPWKHLKLVKLPFDTELPL